MSAAGGSWVAPRSVPGLLDASVRLYFRRFGFFFSIALAARLIAWVVSVIGARPAPALPGMPFLGFMTGGLQPNPLLNLLGNLVVAAAYPVLVLVAAGVATGPGEPPAGGVPLREGLSRFWPFVVVVVAVGVAVSIGLFLLLVPGILLLTWWAVAPVIAVVERSRAAASLGRSRALTRGLFWHTLGAVFLGGLLGAAVGLLLEAAGLPLRALPGAAGGDLYLLWQAAATAVLLPYSVCLLTLLYYDLRARREGADLVDGSGPAA